MGGNFVENPILHDAILELQNQGDFGYKGDVSQLSRTLMLMPDGRLTVVEYIRIVNGKKVLVPDPRYTPVSCYDQIPPDLDLNSAVEWYLENR